MYDKINMFQKLNIILVCLLTPILLLNLYSSRTSNAVVRQEIEKSSETHLALLSNQIDAFANQLTTLALSLNRDPSVRSFVNQIYAIEPYDRYFTLSNLSEKLGLISSSVGWQNIVSVYSPMLQENVSSTNNYPQTDQAYYESKMSVDWSFHQADFHFGSDNYFMRHFVDPTYKEGRPVTEANVVTEVSFSEKNIVKLLDQFKTNDNVNDPLLYKPGVVTIKNASANHDLIAQLLPQLDEAVLNHDGSLKVIMSGEEYMATIHRSDSLDWYLVDYVPVEKILAPIHLTSTIFYASLVVIIVIGSFLSFTLYRNVQKPILLLVGSVRALMRGDYSKRIQYNGHHEFEYLIEQFNKMAQQIQELIEKVYESKIRMQDATLKQLQSQIDPHFLYNCLNFIKNSARMQDEESVVQMSIHLGQYYRYVTRLDAAMTPLSQELDLITNYLEIHKLRHHELQYSLSVPEQMMDMPIPRLLLQPLVENAIQHGIETITEPGRIRVTASMQEGWIRLTVEDNGSGMTTDGMDELRVRIGDHANEDKLCGLWNVAQRLSLQYGRQAGIELEPSADGGLKVSLSWPENEEDAESSKE